MAPYSDLTLGLASVLALLATTTAVDVTMVESPEDYSKLVADDAVVLVEFYSKYCGSCKEFSKHWHALEKTFEGKLKFARVKIDDSGPMKVAQKEGALSGGIPHVRLLTASDATNIVLMSGGSGIKKSHALTEEINEKMKGYKTSEDGVWLKNKAGVEL